MKTWDEDMGEEHVLITLDEEMGSTLDENIGRRHGVTIWDKDMEL